MDESILGWDFDESITPSTKLKQGDLIRFEKENDPLRKEGIIITADCDLDRDKHAKLVTLIPVISVRTLMERYLLIEDCDKKIGQIRSYALKVFDVDPQQDLDVRLAILEEMIKSPDPAVSEVDCIAAGLAVGKVDLISTESYKALMVAIRSSAKKSQDLRQQIESRGDIFVLPDTHKLNLDGEVAWVRNIWQVPIREIAIRTSELGGRAGERIARLDSPFRYRLTQLLAQVFSDIGLPEFSASIEEKVKEAYENV